MDDPTCGLGDLDDGPRQAPGRHQREHRSDGDADDPHDRQGACEIAESVLQRLDGRRQLHDRRLVDRSGEHSERPTLDVDGAEHVSARERLGSQLGVEGHGGRPEDDRPVFGHDLQAGDRLAQLRPGDLDWRRRHDAGLEDAGGDTPDQTVGLCLEALVDRPLEARPGQHGAEHRRRDHHGDDDGADNQRQPPTETHCCALLLLPQRAGRPGSRWSLMRDAPRSRRRGWCGSGAPRRRLRSSCAPPTRRPPASWTRGRRRSPTRVPG